METIDSNVLKERAITINNILSEYIKLHDSFIKSSGSFLSIFRRIDFNKLSGNANFLLEKLKEEKKNLGILKSKTMDSKQKDFYDCLYSYTEALEETVRFLFIMLHVLDQKAKGGKLNFKEHSENNAKYKDSINIYMAQGQKLNELYKTI